MVKTPEKKKPKDNKLKFGCRGCGKEISVKSSEKDDYSFCGKCGGPLVELKRGGYKVTCPCGKKITVKKSEVDDVKFCPKCGQPLFDDVTPATPQEPAQAAAPAPEQSAKPRIAMKKIDLPENPGFSAKFWKKCQLPEFTDELGPWQMKTDYIFGLGRWAQQTHGVSEINAAVTKAAKDKVFTLDRVIYYLDGGAAVPAGAQLRANDTGQLALPPEQQRQKFGHHDPSYRNAILVR